MIPLPSGLIFSNNVSPGIQKKLEQQLYIHETISGQEFDDRFSADPNYPEIIKLQNLRILVLRDFFNITNRNVASLVIFVKLGISSILKNNFGPPGASYIVENLHWDQLIK